MLLYFLVLSLRLLVFLFYAVLARGFGMPAELQDAALRLETWVGCSQLLRRRLFPLLFHDARYESIPEQLTPGDTRSPAIESESP